MKCSEELKGTTDGLMYPVTPSKLVFLDGLVYVYKTLVFIVTFSIFFFCPRKKDLEFLSHNKAVNSEPSHECGLDERL